MKQLLLLLAAFTTTNLLQAQNVPTQSLKQTMTLLMPRTVDHTKPGTRGASVVWNPLQKKYYAAMAGNIEYPLGVYSPAGKRLSDDSVNCNADMRGLWYNPQRKTLQGNAYNTNGWFEITVNAKGMPKTTEVIKEGMNQPGEQSVGAFNPIAQEVLFLDKGYVSFYTYYHAISDNTVRIYWGQSKASEDEEILEETPESYNNTTVIFTGIKGAELGFLNIDNKEVELYNMNTGLLTKRLKLPDTAPMNASFNFAYTNGMYWLFDIEKRTWFAYK